MNAIYTAASGLAAERQWLATIGSNLAAANSPGYLAATDQFAAFPPVMVGRTASPGAPANGQLGSTSWGVATLPAFDNPASGLGLVSTGRMLDVGVSGPGFLTVATPTGTAYTKDGRLFLDSQGTLVTGQGDRVLSTTGAPIHLGAGAVSMAANGTITQNGAAVAQLALVNLSGTLTSQPGNLYTGTIAPSPTSQIVQGALNQSGVSLTKSATAMIQAETAYQGLSTMVTEEATRLSAAAKLGVMA